MFSGNGKWKFKVWKPIHVIWANSNLLKSAFLKMLWTWIHYFNLFSFLLFHFNIDRINIFYNNALERKLLGQLGSLNAFNLYWIEQRVIWNVSSPYTLLFVLLSTFCSLNRVHIFLLPRNETFYMKTKRN